MIQITGGPQQAVLSSLGKLLVNRADWVEFFRKHEDGVVAVHSRGMTTKPPDELHNYLQKIVVDPTEVLERPKRPRKRRARLAPAQQFRMELPDS